MKDKHNYPVMRFDFFHQSLITMIFWHIFSDEDFVRVSHIDHGIITIESISDIGCLPEKFASIEPLLVFVSLVNVIPATNQQWNGSDVKNIHEFMQKMNDRFSLEITPRQKMGNIYLATSVEVVYDEKGFSISLTEHMINRYVGRTDETNLRTFVNILVDLNIIDKPIRTYLLRSSKNTVNRAHYFAYGGPGQSNKKGEVGDQLSSSVSDELVSGQEKQEGEEVDGGETKIEEPNDGGTDSGSNELGATSSEAEESENEMMDAEILGAMSKSTLDQSARFIGGNADKFPF